MHSLQTWNTQLQTDFFYLNVLLTPKRVFLRYPSPPHPPHPFPR